MPFIISNFGTYNDYVAWDNYSGRQYIIKLIDNDLSTEEIVKNNPEGITKYGLSLDRDSVYHGVFESISLSLSFGFKNGGGELIKNAYDTTGVKADVTAEVYKRNPDTNDFDILYNYKIDFGEDSYNYEVYYVSCNLIQIGTFRKMASRDDLEINIDQNTSIDGDSITDVSHLTIDLPPIDVYLVGDATGGSIGIDDDFIGTGTATFPYFGGTEGVEMTGRINFVNPVDGKIYVNDSGAAISTKFLTQFNYALTTICAAGNNITLTIKYVTYDSGDVAQRTVTLFTHTNNAEGTKTESGSIDYEDSTYYEVPDGGYSAFFVQVDYNSASLTPVIFGWTGDSYHKITEEPSTFPQTSAKTYRLHDVLKKGLRILTGVDDIFFSDYIINNCWNTVVLNGWMLRNYLAPRNNLILKFIDVFKIGSYAEGFGMGYDTSTGKFYVEELEEFYQDTQVVDFGTVKNFKSAPFDYYNSLQSGCFSQGKYDENQGAYEFNTKFEYKTRFEIDGKKDMRINAHTDSLAFEFTRREQLFAAINKDTDFDGDLFFLDTDGSEAVTGDMSGFDIVDEYYNSKYIARENIIRNGGILSGIFWKDTSDQIIFSSNSKNINIEYTIDAVTSNLNDNITYSELGSPFFHPEKQEFEADITLTQLAAIRANPHGYYKCEDEAGNEHYGYFQNIEVQDYEKTVTVVGKKANINR